MRQRVFEREQRGLGVAHLVQLAVGTGVAEHQVADRPAEVGGEQPVALVDVLAEHRVPPVQVAAHPGVLRAGTGEQERRLADAGRRALPGAAQPLRLAVQEPGQFLPVVHESGDAVGEVRAAQVGGPAHVGERGVRVVVEIGTVPVDQPAQCRPALRGQREDVPVAVGYRRLRCGVRRLRCGGFRWRRLQDGHADGAREPEPVDHRPPHRRRPRLATGGQPHRVLLPGDPPGRRLVQVREEPAPAHLQDGLHHAADPGGRFHVPEVGLQRADRERVGLAVRGAEHRGDRGHLDRVAQRRTGTVRLDVLDVARGQPGRGEGGPGDGLLGHAVGHREAGALPVLSDRGTADERENPVAVAPGRGQPLEHEHPAALGPGVPVGRLVERLAPPVRGEHVAVREHDQRPRVVDRVDRPAQRDVALAAAQPLDGEVQRGQRGRARGVHGQARPAPAEEVRQPPGQRVDGDPGGEAAVQVLVPQRVQFEGVVDGAGAHVHPAVAVAQRGRVDVGVLQRLPGGLHEQALLRVDVVRLFRRDVEELRVEPVDRVEEPARGRPDPARLLLRPAGVAPAEGRQVEAVLRQRPDARPPFGQELAEHVEVVVAAGKADADADDGDRFVLLQQQPPDRRLLPVDGLLRGAQRVVVRIAGLGHGGPASSGRES